MTSKTEDHLADFEYLKTADIYFDAACQSMRPQPVLDALNKYYTTHNSCGERVKYLWGTITDQKVRATRKKILSYLKLKSNTYDVSFTLNTTYGLNLILNQLDFTKIPIKHIITTDIEHNSVFLSTITLAKTHNLPRTVITRNPDGSIDPNLIPERSLVVVNCASNIDGRLLPNLTEITQKVHATGGLIIIDAAQAMAHHSKILHKTTADAICFSGHKMYAPSLGVIVFRKDLLPKLRTTFIGGGMVDDAFESDFLLSAQNPDRAHTRFEAGLQAWGEIIALGAAIDWLENLPDLAYEDLHYHTKDLYNTIASHPNAHLINTTCSSTITVYFDHLDSHLLGAALADRGIMVRTGYFCAHYYLSHVRKLPPLLRFSLGYHNKPTDIIKATAFLDRI